MCCVMKAVSMCKLYNVLNNSSLFCHPAHVIEPFYTSTTAMAMPCMHRARDEDVGMGVLH